MSADPTGLELAELVEHLHALAAMSVDQDEADRWHRLAELWVRDPAAARAAQAEREAEIRGRADPDTTAALARIFTARNRRTDDALRAELRRRREELRHG